MTLRTSPLREAHAAADARFTDFGGWEMPVEFGSITAEHEAVRGTAGKFDVSHMGQVRVAGPDATTLVQRLTTNDVTALAPGDAQYAAATREDGVMLDDLLVYRRADADGDPVYLVVPNAGHDEGMTIRFTDHAAEWGLDAAVQNLTENRAMVAVQGPEAREIVTDESPESAALLDLGRFEATDATVAGVDCWVARTGYTGEDGFELVYDADEARTVWDALDCAPCGLGARDTLRIEAGYLLSGQDFHPQQEPRTPFEAGIGFAVKLDTEFLGRDALEAQSAEGVDETFVGLRVIDRGIPRHGYPITTPDGEEIGHVTSGTKSPSLDFAAGLGYVPTEYAEEGTKLRVTIRGESKKARIETLPFVETTQ